MKPSMTKSSMESILKCAYRWRSADVHAAACRLGIREDKDGTAEAEAENFLSALAVKLDYLKKIYGDV